MGISLLPVMCRSRSFGLQVRSLHMLQEIKERVDVGAGQVILCVWAWEVKN